MSPICPELLQALDHDPLGLARADLAHHATLNECRILGNQHPLLVGETPPVAARIIGLAPREVSVLIGRVAAGGCVLLVGELVPEIEPRARDVLPRPGAREFRARRARRMRKEQKRPLRPEDAGQRVQEHRHRMPVVLTRPVELRDVIQDHHIGLVVVYLLGEMALHAGELQLAVLGADQRVVLALPWHQHEIVAEGIECDLMVPRDLRLPPPQLVVIVLAGPHEHA
jgi:hypothetical protein